MSHFYTKSGEARHFVPKKSGGNRPTTINDARAESLLPSATTVLKILDKPALTEWLVRQAVYAVTTAADVAGEGLDAKIARVLDRERQQDQESQMARDKGTAIHEAIERELMGEWWNPELEDYVFPATDALKSIGRIVATEKILVGKYCAGKTDCIIERDDVITVVDFKTTKTLPKASYPEARMQLAFYCSAIGSTGDKRIEAMNIYISTSEPGKITICPLGDWSIDLKKFNLILEYFYLANGLTMEPKEKTA